MVKRLIVALIILYPLSYAGFRALNTEVWSEDQKAYVIYPEKPLLLYYVFRPLSYLDGYLTGMGSHIGPHQ